MIQRGGQVGIRILEDVRQTTSQPLIEATIRPGTLVPTDSIKSLKVLLDFQICVHWHSFAAKNNRQ